MKREDLIALPTDLSEAQVEGREVALDRGVLIHFPAVWGEYRTLCGEGGGGEGETALPAGARVNCGHCLAIYAALRKVPRSLIGTAAPE